jgi:nitrogen fixation/metabolism regulation signal transduction histidine kinase
MSPITRFNEDGEVQAFFPITTINQGTLGFLRLKNGKNEGPTVEPLSDFLGTILNLYVFLFLIAGAIAIAVSRSITKPLSTLSLKFNSIKVGQKNEIINWESDDEIGSLIANYNDMVQKLDLNIELLAKTERDSAWQEMAKQVAHEIKNPLTPMKLSLQYLQSSIGRHPDRAEELIKRTSHTLLEQIDNLTEIANAFSNLASLPQADNDKIILNEVVDAVHDLFRKRDDIDIQLAEPLEEIVVFADKGHLVRILNNIVKNAIQSIPQDKAGKIDIRLYKAQNNAIISVEDNGEGIPTHLRSKIFTPKFTTKSSGSGLGLAIAKNMIESFNGHIYFDTEVGKGTTFFIEIPLMRNPLPKEGLKRVEL